MVNSKDDILPNLDVKEQTAAADTEHTDKEDKPNRERKHFPSNINKIGYALFSVSCSYMRICIHYLCIATCDMYIHTLPCNNISIVHAVN